MENRERVNTDDIIAVQEVWFYPETYRFFQDGLRKLKSVLSDLRSEFAHSMNVLGIDDSAFRELDTNIKRLDRMISWGDTQLERNDEILVSRPSYGSLRLLKAGGILQVREYEQMRATLLGSHSIVPKSLLRAIDDRLSQMRDRLEQGALNGLQPADIFLEIDGLAKRSAGDIDDKAESGVTLPTIVVESDELPILDDQLRARCLDLLRAFDGDGKGDRLDTVVREMSVILEDRVRDVAGITEKLNPEKLMATAFANPSPRLVFSTESDAQQSAYLLFKGYIGFFRNDAMHKLIATYTRDRVYQLLGYVDLLLFLLTQANRSQTCAQPVSEPVRDAPKSKDK